MEDSPGTLQSKWKRLFGFSGSAVNSPRAVSPDRRPHQASAGGSLGRSTPPLLSAVNGSPHASRVPDSAAAHAEEGLSGVPAWLAQSYSSTPRNARRSLAASDVAPEDVFTLDDLAAELGQEEGGNSGGLLRIKTGKGKGKGASRLVGGGEVLRDVAAAGEPVTHAGSSTADSGVPLNQQIDYSAPVTLIPHVPQGSPRHHHHHHHHPLHGMSPLAYNTRGGHSAATVSPPSAVTSGSSYQTAGSSGATRSSFHTGRGDTSSQQAASSAAAGAPAVADLLGTGLAVTSPVQPRQLLGVMEQAGGEAAARDGSVGGLSAAPPPFKLGVGL